ncbi:MAG TPA: dienelactone hydrolase family protein [Stellaceae bacterium]|nr:dienelactone hydrolase family protein [Stellaceae bacterium]
MINTVSIAAPDGKMDVMLGIPDGAGPFATLVVAHHRWGLDPFTHGVIERLNANGFIAGAPNFYHRRPAGEDSAEAMKYLADDQIIGDIKATTAHLQALPRAKRGAQGIMGHCMGGRHSFLGATAHPFKAAVMLYGGGITQPRGGNPPALSRAAGIACPLLGFFGKDDKNPSPADMAEIDAELTRLGKQHEFHAYDGAGHAFQNTTDERYRPAASEDAWQRYLAFFHEALA